jgi:hypothetical protein
VVVVLFVLSFGGEVRAADGCAAELILHSLPALAGLGEVLAGFRHLGIQSWRLVDFLVAAFFTPVSLFPFFGRLLDLLIHGHNSFVILVKRSDLLG